MRRNRYRQESAMSFRINTGTVIFIVIFIYLVIRILMSFQKESFSIYEVQNSYIDTNINTTALIVRDETIVNAEGSGYVSYYVRDGEKIGKDKTVYTIDETGSVYEILKETESSDLMMSGERLEEVRTRISNFENYFDFSNFSDVYNFRYDIENAVLELTNETLIEQVTSLESDSVNQSTYKKIASKEAGIITYYQDGFENFDVHKFKASDIDKNGYQKQTLKTGDIINVGDPVYKLINSENWYLVAPITEDQAKEISKKDTVKLNIHNSSKNIYCDYELTKQDKENFIIIFMNQQMVNYINDRYIDIVIFMDQNNGLKIPNTSITKKKVYKIPKEYLSSGSDSAQANFLNVKKINEKGDISMDQKKATIYKMDDQFCYINPDDFNESDVIVNINNNENLALSNATTEELDGIFCVNQGIAVFRYIDIRYQDDEYTIVKDNEDYSIAWYDRIVLDATTVDENQIIK